MAVTPDVAALIDPDDPSDPIGRQFLPNAAELHAAPEERLDPIGDRRFEVVKGLIHRYPDRALLKPVHVCPVYCRFCFRREFVGPGGDSLNSADLERCFEHIRRTTAIKEIILTGGDPLMLSPERLSFIIGELGAIPHLELIRIHSRVPIVDTGRVTDDLIAALDSEKPVFLVVHANHPRELTDKVAATARRLSRAGIPLLSQSVLLRGVNDDETVLETLFRRLLALRIKPYYLHHPDLAPGTEHFRLPLERGQELMRHLRGRLSGLAQPHYVLDLPDGYGKAPVGPAYAERKDPDAWELTDFNGGTHLYPPESPYRLS